MRTRILTIVTILMFFMLTLVGYFHQRQLPGFPDDQALLELVQQRSPASFWSKLAAITGRSELDSALIWSALSRFEHLTLTHDDRVSLDAVRAALYLRLKHYAQAEISLRHVIATSRFASETSQSLEMLKIYYAETGRGVVASGAPAAPPKDQPGAIMFFTVLWVLLLLFPAAVTNVEKHNWLARYASRADRRGPFIAFVYSPMCNVLISISAILLLSLRVAEHLEIQATFSFLFFHLLLSWFFCQIPLHSIESLVKKNSNGLLSYCFEQLSLMLVRHLALISATLALIVLHLMVTWLPIWPITRPVGAAVSPVVFFASIYLMLQLVLPWLMFKRYSAGDLNIDLPQKIYTSRDGYRQGIVEIGALSFSAASVIFGGMQNHLSGENLRLLLTRSRRKFEHNAVFNDFLLIIAFTSGLSILPAISPIFWARLFGSGPYFIEALALLSGVAFCGILRRTLERSQQMEIDTTFAAENLSDQLLQSLEIINKLNFFPENMREGERSEFDPLTLDESRVNLRAATGLYLPATSRPDGLVLVSLWRGRLAVDWKLGRDESAFLTSLDYQVSASDSESELCALAARHNRLGADCIYLAPQQQLKVVFCSQKFSAFTAETPLPQDKICQICSEGMLKACQFGPYKWESTPEGCIFSVDNAPQTREVE
ncbi:MAG: hypothetical protein GX569_08065 [Candidatus Riflebacteria bacterium]|nr:hypothetical protein [Candidatus Riflebacteria bacterium]